MFHVSMVPDMSALDQKLPDAREHAVPLTTVSLALRMGLSVCRVNQHQPRMDCESDSIPAWGPDPQTHSYLHQFGREDSSFWLFSALVPRG